MVLAGANSLRDLTNVDTWECLKNGKSLTHIIVRWGIESRRAPHDQGPSPINSINLPSPGPYPPSPCFAKATQSTISGPKVIWREVHILWPVDTWWTLNVHSVGLVVCKYWYSGVAERAMAAPSAPKVPSILGQVPPILGQIAPNFRLKCPR